MDILVLLMGGNPLPNYITASYLLTSQREDQNDLPVPGKILFVSTNRTKNFYSTIIDLLKKKHQGEFPQTDEIELYDEHRSPGTIQDKIRKALEKHSDIKSIHLNYTGGTKPMAVNAVITASSFDRGKDIKLILSDVDPDNFKLTTIDFSSNGGIFKEKRFPVSGDLRDWVHLSVDDLFSLHEMKPGPEKRKDPLSNSQMIDITQFSLTLASDYKTDTRRKRFLEISKELAIADPGINKKIVANHPYLKGIFDEDSKLKITPGQFHAFICGKWLEHYLYATLNKLKTKPHFSFSDIRMGVEAEYENRPCEIDVIALRGFQMFLFSCTTSQKIKLVKQKAFEALFRAEQLGGEHARVIVVSTMFNNPGIPGKIKFSRKSNLQELEKDLKQFNASQKCCLVGINELSDEGKFINKLSDIITQN